MSGDLKQGFGLQAGGAGGSHTVNTNIANADLTITDGLDKTTDVAAETISIESSGTEVIKFNGANDTVVIGPTGADYSMPTNRGTDLDVLMSNGVGASSWQARRETIDIQAYNDDIGITNNYFYAVPMTNTRYKALCNVDLASTNVTTAITTSAVIRGGYYVVNRPMIIRGMTGWGTANIGNTCQIDIVKFTPEDGSLDTIRGVSVLTATFVGGSSNLRTMELVQGIAAADEFLVGDVLMPMIKINGEVEGVENAVIFNLTLELG